MVDFPTICCLKTVIIPFNGAVVIIYTPNTSIVADIWSRLVPGTELALIFLLALCDPV